MNKHNTDIRTSSQNILKKFSSRITNEIQWWIAEASQQSTEHYLFNIKSYTKYKNTQRIIEIKKHKSTHKLNNNFHVWKLAGDKNWKVWWQCAVSSFMNIEQHVKMLCCA